MKTKRVYVGDDGKGMLSGCMYKYVSEMEHTDLGGAVRFLIETEFDNSYGQYEYIYADGEMVYRSMWCDLTERLDEDMGPVPEIVAEAMTQHRKAVTYQEENPEMKNKNGGPAFPRPHFRLSNGTLEGGEGGMTLRDYFAAKAMQGLLQYTYTHADRASVAYKAADAMLKAREENV